jgi:hypothetical protein
MLDVAGNVKAAKFIGDGSLLTNLPSGGGGTITGVTAANGLTGGGTSGSVSLGIATGGVTNGMMQNSTISISAGTGLKGTGSGPIPLGGTGFPLEVDFALTQKRVSGTCLGSDQAIQTVKADGTVDCVSVTGGIGGSGAPNLVPRFTDSHTLGNSQISDDGQSVSIGNPLVTRTITIQAGDGGYRVHPAAEGVNIVGGSSSNVIPDSVSGGTVSGGGAGSGLLNSVLGDFGSVGGGYGNHADQFAAVVAGGGNNGAVGMASTVPGGLNNEANGKFSLAAGVGASAVQDSTFVWNDGGTAVCPSDNPQNCEIIVNSFSSTAPNQFLIHAAGGVGIGTNAPGEQLDVNGNVRAVKFIGDGSMLMNLPSGGGTITGVTAGSGLTGGGTTGTVSVGIAAGGVTNAMLQHSSIDVSLPANSGLTGGGTISLGSGAPLSVDFTSAQRRVSQNCGIGSAIRSVNEDGSVACEPVVSTGLTGAGGINFLSKFTGPNAVGGSVVFDDGSQVGIGTTSPVAKLHVDAGNTPIAGWFLTNAPGGAAITALATDTGASGVNVGVDGESYGVNAIGVAGEGLGSNGAGVRGDGWAYGVIGQTPFASGIGGYFQNGEPGGKALVAVTDTRAEAFTVRSSGNVGIQNPNPAEALDVNGNVKANGLCLGADCRTAWPSAGTGTITGVTAVNGLSGGGTTGTVSVGIAAGGVTNAMLQNTAVNVLAGNGLTGGGQIALGGSTSLAINTTIVPRLNAANTFTQGQSITTAGGNSLTVSNTATTGGAIVASTSATTGVSSPAVTGNATAANASSVGVLGQSFSTNGGVGVEGVAQSSSTTGASFGVKGETSTGGSGTAGVYGSAISPTGNTFGVYGQSASAGGTGVFGTAPNTSGVGTGVYGTAAGTFGAYGVQGQATAGTGTTFGGAFSSASNTGTGVYGFTTHASGGFAGVWGVANSGTAVGGVFENTAGGDLLLARTAGVAKFRVANDGNVTAAGTFTGGGADFAESVDVVDGAAAYVPGDVLVVDRRGDRRFALAREPYSALVAGIYSTKPGMLGSRSSMDDNHRADEIPMAVVGIVPTKVSAENGPIRRGDLLVTSSTPGYAMKGTDRDRMLGAVVGKALEPLAEGTGIIEVLVTVQ